LSAPAQPLVHVLVLNYGSLEDTIQCVDTVRRSCYSNVRLLVIDNASPDGSGAVLEARLDPTEFLQLSTNTGYAGGNNAGIRIALAEGARYILVVNPDVRLSEVTISRCVELMEGDPTIGAVNPIQLDGEGGRLDEKFRLGVFVRHGFPEPAIPVREERCWETVTLYGAALMLGRETLVRTGGFDPLFFAYGEEEDLARRIRLKRLRLVVTSAGAVRHLRTNEGRVSDFVLFLRLKGVYLHILKDPSVGFREATRRVLDVMRRDLRRPRPDRYPFKQFPITRRHVLKAIAWIALHAPQIYRHRRMERDAPYLS
jgi:GT2 family glycosyltransferase